MFVSAQFNGSKKAKKGKKDMATENISGGNLISRRGFVSAGAALFAAAGCTTPGEKIETIQGFDETESGANKETAYVPFSDRKVRVGIAGEGFCGFGSAFGYQKHPNAEVVACAELDAARRERLQGRVGAKKAYTSCEDMIKHAAEDKLDAIYIATDARSHIQLCIMALEHGLHVASAVPAFLGKDQLEFVPKLLDAERSSGKIYMMNETSAFRPDCFAMRRLYEAGMLGKITYSEGEYFHPSGNNPDADRGKPHDNFSYGGWRWGLPPQYYPTHSNAYYSCVTHGRFVEVTCRGVPSLMFKYRPEAKNEYGNTYGSEYAMLKCSDGSSARMLVSWDTPSFGAERGRIWGQKGCFVPEKLRPGDDVPLHGGYLGWFSDKVKAMDLRKPALPPGMPAGGHGGSHGYLTDDFLRAILVKDHKVCVDSKLSLNMTMAGVYAHMSAMKDGETLKIPQV